MSNDPEQEHFADGLTEDLITALSRKQWYDVAARNSTFAYKGRSVDVRELGEHLDHDQICPPIHGYPIWQSVVKEIDDIDESDYGLFEWSYSAIGLIHEISPECNRLATERLLKALAIDAEVAVVHLGLGFCYLIDWGFMGDSVGGSLEKAHEHAEIHLRLSPNDAHTYRLFSRVYAGMRRYEESERCVERALSIDPDDSDLVLNKGLFLQQTGKPAEALDCFDAVLNSHDETPHTVDIARAWKGLTLLVMEDYDKAVTVLQEISGLNYLKNLFLAAGHAALGDDQKARAAIAQVLQACPDLRANNMGFCKNYRDTAIGDRLRLAFSRAGLPPE